MLLRQAGQVLGRGHPDGERWEIYTVLADSETFGPTDESGPACCTDQTAEQAAEPAPACC